MMIESYCGGDGLNKKSVFIAVSLVLAAFIGFIVYEIATDPWDDKYKDRVEYPLEKVDINDTSAYMLVKWQHSPMEKYEIVTDTQAIKDNKSIFSVDNNGQIYGTTADGVIWLFKDGKQIDTVIFDNTLTKEIDYGTLLFQQINELQYQLLIGYEIVRQEQNYTILCDNRNEKPYYSCFAHGDDLESISTVYLLNSDNNIHKMAKPNHINEDIIEFVEHSADNAGNQTRHWYFRISDIKLSSWYWNVRAIKDDLIIYASSYRNGGKSRMIIHNMFDQSIGYKEIIGDFPDPRDDDFLLTAEFMADGGIHAEYIGKDGHVHNDVFY